MFVPGTPGTPAFPWAKLLLLPYHCLLLMFFSMVYASIGLKQHFGVENPTPFMPYYFSVVSHTSTGYGDIAPRTDLARKIVTAHLCLAWVPTAILTFMF